MACNPATMDKFASDYLPFIDFHIHLRGGMTPQKAIDRQAVTGINCGVLRNLGQGWPIETDEQLKEFLDSVEGLPLFVGLQVNDRDWMDRHSSDLIQRLDFVLADTMIMPMPDDDSEPVKLWLADTYSIADPEAWMERYMQHNLRVLSEPITILANPTYLPPALEDQYDQLWTDTRMRQVIQAAIDNHVALEINASSQWPHDRFIRMAKEMGAKFSFGSNNFNDAPIDMTRCFEAIAKYGLVKDDMYVPAAGRNPKVEMTESQNMIRLQFASDEPSREDGTVPPVTRRPHLSGRRSAPLHRRRRCVAGGPFEIEITRSLAEDKRTGSAPQSSSLMRMSLYQASLGGPPWICRPISPFCSIVSSGSV